jgi:methionine aminopeptidase
MATMTIQELCQSVKSRHGEESACSKEEAEEEFPFPTFGGAVSSFQAVRRN